MIKRFSVKNFRNFKEKLVLDLSKPREYNFNEHLIKNGIVNKLLIYGPNNAGKSNLGAAIMDITTHLTDNFGNQNLLYTYYTNGYYPEDYVEFCYELLLNGKNVTYTYTKDANRKLVNEELLEDGKVLFKYSYITNDYEVNIPQAKGLDLKKRNNDTAVLKYIYSREIFWPEDDVFRCFMEFVNNMLWFRSLKGNEFMGVMPNSEDLHDFILNNRLLGKFKSFLKECGQDYDLEEMVNNGKKVIGVRYNNSLALFDLVASTGTQSLWLFFYWINRTKNISFLYLDEFDAFYHYELATHILQTVNEGTAYQSILTSHNTYLIDNGLMRPDCYAILSNGKISSFSERTNKVIRQAQNLQKMMLGGEFGK